MESLDQSADELIQRAEMLIQLKPKDAIRRLEAAIQLDPANYRPFVLLAQAHAKLGNLDASDDAAKTALGLRPDVPDIHIAMGNNALKRKRPREAAAAFARAAELVGNRSAGLLAAQAWALSSARQQKEAERLAREALSLAPDPLAYRTMARIAWVRGNRRRAEAWSREGLYHNPTDPGLMGFLGGSLLYQGRIEEARTPLSQAIRMEPEDPWLERLWTLYRVLSVHSWTRPIWRVSRWLRAYRFRFALLYLAVIAFVPSNPPYNAIPTVCMLVMLFLLWFDRLLLLWPAGNDGGSWRLRDPRD